MQPGDTVLPHDGGDGVPVAAGLRAADGEAVLLPIDLVERRRGAQEDGGGTRVGSRLVHAGGELRPTVEAIGVSDDLTRVGLGDIWSAGTGCEPGGQAAMHVHGHAVPDEGRAVVPVDLADGHEV